MKARVPRGLAAAVAIGLSLVAPLLAAAGGAAEGGAKDAIKRAASDFAATDYATAVARLEKAARTCGPKHCTRATRAFVLRDLGTMQFRMGDKAAAANSFAEALSIEPDLELSAKYDAPDLHAAWDQARAAAQTGPAVELPTGDFTHTPPSEQKANTPIPVYVEYPGDTPPARVVVKYRGARMADWATVDLSTTDGGWEGLIPCADVAPGTMHYWVQGFDDGGDPSTSSGDPKHSYAVPIHDQLAGEAPHLPGKPPPRTCAEGEGSGDESEGKGYARLWLGVAGSIEFLSMPEAIDACKLTPAGVPSNAAALYCTTPDGLDFPTRSLPAGPAENAALVPGQAGRIGGGLQGGDVRIMLSADYALRPNVLVGGRLGYVANAYPADAASKDGRAAGFRVHIEARATYLFGTAPLARTGFSPMAFAGAGLAEFDGHSGTAVTLSNVKGQEPVDVWRTDGPGFLLFGGGVRYQFSRRAAFTGAFRLNVAFGNDALITYGPEIGAAYGF